MRFEWEVIIIRIVLAIMVITILWLLVSLPGIFERENRLMVDCMKEHQEYECVAMLRNSHTTTIIPVR